MCPGQDAFEEPFDHELNGNWTSVIIQGVLRAMRDLVEEDRMESFTVREIEKKFNDTYQKGGLGLTKHQLTKIVQELCAGDALKQYGADASSGLKRFAAKNTAGIGSLINPDLNDHLKDYR